MADLRAGSPRGSSASGTAEAFQALAAAWYSKATAIDLLFFFFFFSNQKVIIIIKEILKQECREPSGRLHALPRLSGDLEGKDAAPLSAHTHTFPCPLGSGAVQRFAA